MANSQYLTKGRNHRIPVKEDNLPVEVQVMRRSSLVPTDMQSGALPSMKLYRKNLKVVDHHNRQFGIKTK